jgi:hypothetical protein
MNRIEEERISEENMGSLNSRKKSRASNNQSRVSSKNSKEHSLSKTKQREEKKSIFASENPIVEVDFDEMKSTNSGKEYSRPEERHVGGSKTNLFKSFGKINHFSEQLQKKLSNPVNIQKGEAKKTGSLSVKTDEMVKSIKMNTPREQPKTSTRDNTAKESKLSLNVLKVQKLITNFKNGTSGSWKDVFDGENASKAPSHPKTTVSTAFCATTKLMPTLSKTKKVGNHRRTCSDTNSLTYQIKNKPTVSARGQPPPPSTAIEVNSLEQALYAGTMHEQEDKDSQQSVSYKSINSSIRNQMLKTEEPLKENPWSKTTSNFAKKAGPKTLVSESNKDRVSELHLQISQLKKENAQLALENSQLKVETGKKTSVMWVLERS